MGLRRTGDRDILEIIKLKWNWTGPSRKQQLTNGPHRPPTRFSETKNETEG